MGKYMYNFTMFMLRIQDTPRAKVRSKLSLSFVNPLNRELTLGYFTVEAPGLVRPVKIRVR
jgi:hypothetical protein